MTQPTQSFKKIAILGIGNLLRADEGLGVHVLKKLQAEHRLADHVIAIDGGVMGLDLLTFLDGVEAIMIIDAIDAEKPPGAVVRLDGEALDATWQQKFSMHQAGVFDLLSVLQFRGDKPQRVVVWGVQPLTIEWSLELSPPVAASVDQLVADIAAELKSWNALLPPAT